MREADLPAEQPEAQEEARLPVADAHPCGARRPQDPSPARTRPAVGLIWRVRGHAAFRDLARAPVRRQGALSARFLPVDGDGPPRVAYAIPRSVGGAVERNRLRRRLRATVRDLEPELRPGAYLVGAGASVMSTTPAELRESLATVLQRAAEQASR